MCTPSCVAVVRRQLPKVKVFVSSYRSDVRYSEKSAWLIWLDSEGGLVHRKHLTLMVKG